MSRYHEPPRPSLHRTEPARHADPVARWLSVIALALSLFALGYVAWNFVQ